MHRLHPHCKCHFHPFSVVREIDLSLTLLHVHPQHRLEFAVFAKRLELLSMFHRHSRCCVYRARLRGLSCLILIDAHATDFAMGDLVDHGTGS